MGRYEGDRKLGKKAGLNRFVWDLRYPVVDFPERTIIWGFLGGPRVAPGTYKATLRIGDVKQEQTFQVLKDPRFEASQEDLAAQVAFQLQIRDRLNQVYRGVKVLRDVRRQSKELVDRLNQSGKDVTELRKKSEDLDKQLTAIEEELMQPRNEADQDTENFPTKLDNQLGYIYMHLDLTDSRPTDGQRERVRDLEEQIKLQLSKLNQILDADVAAFNKLALEAGASFVMLPGQTPN